MKPRLDEATLIAQIQRAESTWDRNALILEAIETHAATRIAVLRKLVQIAERTFSESDLRWMELGHRDELYIYFFRQWTYLASRRERWDLVWENASTLLWVWQRRRHAPVSYHSIFGLVFSQLSSYLHLPAIARLALEHTFGYIQSLPKQDNAPNPFNAPMRQLNLATLYLQLSDLPRALRHLQSAETHLRQLPHSHTHLFGAQLWGEYWLQQGDAPRAETSLRAAMQAPDLIGHSNWILAWWTLGRALLAQARHPEALEALWNGVRRCREGRVTRFMPRLYEGLAQAYRALRRPWQTVRALEKQRLWEKRLHRHLAAAHLLSDFLQKNCPADLHSPASTRLPSPPQPIPPQEQPWADELETVLLANFSDPNFGVDSLAAALALSARHLRRRLESLFALSPHELLLHTRLEAARTLLRQHPHKPIAHIARQSGFRSATYFNQVFKKYMGLLPRAYAQMAED